DLETGRREPAAAQADEGRRPPHPLGEVVDVDRLPLQARQDRLQFGERLAVTQTVEVVVGPGHAPLPAPSTRLVTVPSATVVSTSSPGARSPTDRTRT